MDPVALKIQNLIPLPNNGTTLVNNWVQQYTFGATQTVFTFKIDHNISDKQHLSGLLLAPGHHGMERAGRFTRSGNGNPQWARRHSHCSHQLRLLHYADCAVPPRAWDLFAI